MNRCAGSGACPPVLAWVLCWSVGSIVRSHRWRRNAWSKVDEENHSSLSGKVVVVLETAAVAVVVLVECGFCSPTSRLVSEGTAWSWTAMTETSLGSCARHVACAVHGRDGKAGWPWCQKPGIAVIPSSNRSLWRRARSRNGCFPDLGMRRSFAPWGGGHHRTGNSGLNLNDHAAVVAGVAAAVVALVGVGRLC